MLNKKIVACSYAGLLLLSVLVSYGSYVTAEYVLDDTILIQAGNENYTFPSGGIPFDVVKYNESGSWTQFNTTGINITSTNPINITISYLNAHSDSSTSGAYILNFSANTTAGTVWFNISGFAFSTGYSVYRDAALLGYYISGGSGLLSFSNNVWSEHTFTIYVGVPAGTSTGYEYGNWSHSEHINGTNDLEEAWTMNNDNWTTTDNSAWWAGNFTLSYNISNADDDFGFAILNDSGMNRSQSFGWVKLNYTGEPLTVLPYPMIIFNYNTTSDFYGVIFDNDDTYFVYWNGTDLIDVETGLPWDTFIGWENQFNTNWDQFYPTDGVFWKLLFNEYTGKVKFKYWGPDFMAEPVGWVAEYDDADLVAVDHRSYGIGVWNPGGFINGTQQMHFDLVNLWQLNYTVNESATISLNGNNHPRPHMEFPVMNLSNFTDVAEYINSTFTGNFTVIDAIRDIMKDNITNQMNLESRMWEPLTLDVLDQNDTIYYYSALYDNVINFTEEVLNDTAPPWLYDEYLHLQVQVCPDGDFGDAGAGVYYDDLIISIDVDDNGIWESNDRLFWMGADGLREQLNGDVWVMTPEFNGTVWLSDTSAVGNLHRYESHMNYGFNLPLATLVKNNSFPLNASDVFGLSIIVFDDGAETAAVWQNWNETTGNPIFPELTDVSVAEYFLNASGTGFFINGTSLGRWGEGVIPGEFNASGYLSFQMEIDATWNVTVTTIGTTYALINGTIWVNNTGTGPLTNITVNQTWFNCSCSDLNMTFIGTNLSLTNLSWNNDSCYWIFSNVSLTLLPGETWLFWFNVNITACPGITTTTETVVTVGNATELYKEVSSDNITFTWGYTPTIRISYGVNLLGFAGILLTGFIMIAVLAIAVIGGYLFYIFKKRGG